MNFLMLSTWFTSKNFNDSTGNAGTIIETDDMMVLKLIPEPKVAVGNAQ